MPMMSKATVISMAENPRHLRVAVKWIAINTPQHVATP
jgi:hypothetical protein